ncbi:AHH domain-containing protein [Vibrio harveyi]|uniref:Uncharacterized protein n=2 Tax=Vibrio harveyi group TaxID=717610 RepID=A0ABM5Y4Q4_VIBHA|nr:AHH domain-containing protein [Vibrio harveyi]AMG00631.1 hypothetical protein AL538_23430 [Vibrio harveyi]EKO3834066.1 AHH domain-containing protein [Vibrio harveyi]
MTALMAKLLSVKLYEKENKSQIIKNIKIGSQGVLGRKDYWSIANKVLKPSIKYPDKHPWHSKALSSHITGHHIISVASLKTLKSDYRTLLLLSKYNVNHPRNIVGLPTSPQVACQLNVPLHYSSHTSDAIPTIEDSPSYHVISSMLIKKMISLLLSKGICPGDSLEEQKKVLLNIDYISAIKLKYITNFKIVLHKTGADYLKGNIGCGGVEKESLKEEGSQCEARSHSYPFNKNDLMTSDHSRLLTIYEIENSKVVYNAN